MTFEFYITLYDNRKFDGKNAWTHLVKNLGMVARHAQEVPEIQEIFDIWLKRHNGCITVHPSGPIFIMAPIWFT